MNFTVSWSEEAESRLAQAWLSATDRHVISEVANRIDSMLQRDAQDIGESRAENRRILHEPRSVSSFRSMWRIAACWY